MNPQRAPCRAPAPGGSGLAAQGVPEPAQAGLRTARPLHEGGLRGPGAGEPSLGPVLTPEEDKLLGTATDREVGERIGRPTCTVACRRYRLGIPCFASN